MSDMWQQCTTECDFLTVYMLSVHVINVWHVTAAYHWMWFSQRTAGKRRSCRASAPPLASCQKPPGHPWSQCHSCQARHSSTRAQQELGVGLSTDTRSERIDRPSVCKTGTAQCYTNTIFSNWSLFFFWVLRSCLTAGKCIWDSIIHAMPYLRLPTKDDGGGGRSSLLSNPICFYMGHLQKKLINTVTKVEWRKQSTDFCQISDVLENLFEK